MRREAGRSVTDTIVSEGMSNDMNDEMTDSYHITFVNIVNDLICSCISAVGIEPSTTGLECGHCTCYTTKAQKDTGQL